jgi:hypothetical protein
VTGRALSVRNSMSLLRRPEATRTAVVGVEWMLPVVTESDAQPPSCRQELQLEHASG